MRRAPFAIVTVSLLFVLEALQSWRMRKVHAATRPFLKLRADVFRDKHDLRAAPNHLVLRRIRLRSNQRQNCSPIRRSNPHPPLASLQPSIKRQVKPQLIQIKSQAAILIAHVYVHAVHPQMQIPPRRGREATHRGRLYVRRHPGDARTEGNDQAAPSIRSHHPAMINRLLLVAALAIPSSFGALPWDKAPEKWDRSDAYRILQDSPWSPAQVKLDTRSTTHYTDRQTGRVDDFSLNRDQTNPVSGVEVRPGKELPPIPVLWWSSKVVRLAQQRLKQLRGSAGPAQPLDAPNLPDYVLAIEGSEPQRILRDPAQDLHDTIFLELPDGVTVDLTEARFVAATDAQ